MIKGVNVGGIGGGNCISNGGSGIENGGCCLEKNVKNVNWINGMSIRGARG